MTFAQSTTLADAAPTERKPLGWRVLVSILTFSVLSAWAVVGTDPSRSEALPSILVEIFTWTGVLFVVMHRHPDGELRLSDPFVMGPVLFMNFYILPAITWLHGADFSSYWGELGVLSESMVSRVQYMHVVFMVAMTAGYYAVMPRGAVVGVPRGERPSFAPPVAWLLVIGLSQVLYIVIERLVSGGGLLPTQTYGDSWYSMQDELVSARNEGGGTQIASQVWSKFFFMVMIAYGIANGILLAKAVARRKRWMIALLMVQVPAILILGIGGRSAVLIPFIVAFCIADLLVGPLKWRWLAVLALAGSLGFSFFGEYRYYQDRGLSQAVTLAWEGYSAGRKGTEGAGNLSAEGPGMLVKECYGIAWVDAHQTFRGADYVIESVLSLLPLQIIPQKAQWMSTAVLLSHEMLGRQALYGAGVAGATLVDGYMMAGELGVILVAAMLGALYGFAVRVALWFPGTPEGGTKLWRATLAVAFCGFSVTLIRGDLSSLLSQMLYHLLVPGVIAAVLLQKPDSPWNRRLGFRSTV